jgi:hypothetical protein
VIPRYLSIVIPAKAGIHFDFDFFAMEITAKNGFQLALE